MSVCEFVCAAFSLAYWRVRLCVRVCVCALFVFWFSGLIKISSFENGLRIQLSQENELCRPVLVHEFML